MSQPDQTKRGRGPRHVGALVAPQLRSNSEARGFAVSRVLTRWDEIVGKDVAKIATPVKVSYSRGAFGATLTILTTGAQAPMLEMRKEKIREKVNAVYGYQAIARIRLTQTAPTGFERHDNAQEASETAKRPSKPSSQAHQIARQKTRTITDPGLRDALCALATSVYDRMEKKRGTEK